MKATRGECWNWGNPLREGQGRDNAGELQCSVLNAPFHAHQFHCLWIGPSMAAFEQEVCFCPTLLPCRVPRSYAHYLLSSICCFPRFRKSVAQPSPMQAFGRSAPPVQNCVESHWWLWRAYCLLSWAGGGLRWKHAVSWTWQQSRKWLTVPFHSLGLDCFSNNHGVLNTMTHVLAN